MSGEFKMNEELCASCGKPIMWGSFVVAVRYGRIKAAVSHTSVSKDTVDYFHPGCDKSFRGSLK